MTQHNRPSTVGVRVINFLPGTAWFLLGLILICLPGEDVPKDDFLNSINFDKIVHSALFGGIVFLFCMPFKKAGYSRKDKLQLFIKITLATCVWGLATEFIQRYFITGRQFDLIDWAADSFGAVVAYFISVKFFAPS